MFQSRYSLDKYCGDDKYWSSISWYLAGFCLSFWHKIHVIPFYCFNRGWMIPDSIPGRRKEIFLFSKMSKSALAPIKPPIQLVPKVLLLEVKWSNVKPTTNLHLVPRVRMSRTIWPHHMQILPSNFQKAQNLVSTIPRLWTELLWKYSSIPGMKTGSRILPAS